MPEKKIKLCSASRMTFRAWFYRTDPQNLGGQFGTLSGFLRNTFRKGTSQRSPEIYFRVKSFRTIFEKRAPVYSLEAPLLGLAKSIYYPVVARPWDAQAQKSLRPFRILCVKYAHVCVNGNSVIFKITHKGDKH